MKMDRVSESLRKVRAAVDSIKKLGIDRDILIVYLSVKSGLARYQVKEVLDQQDIFFKKLCKIGEDDGPKLR
jgi:hypothetical protein